jgi:hypothetical protein
MAFKDLLVALRDDQLRTSPTSMTR